MRLGRVTVTNFRAIKEASLDLDDVTVLLGENNAGKSSFIAALDLFFASSPRVKLTDFHSANTSAEIGVTIEFVHLTPAERELFSANLVDDSLTVTRHFHFEAGRENYGYSVDKMVYPGFDACRAEEGKTQKKKLYDELPPELGLPQISRADEIEPAFEVWEAANSSKLVRKRVGGFRGFKNVASGQIKKNTDFVLVTAVKDAGAEIGQSKTSPVKQLIDAVARQTIQNSAPFRQFVSEASEKLSALTSPDAVPGLIKINEHLTSILARYYKDSTITATWDAVNDLPVHLPAAEIAVTDHGFTTSIEGVGHGLQRAIVLTVLQYLAEHGAADEKQQSFEEPQSDIIIAIEEPELYQHPTKQRLFKKVFRDLCRSFNESNGIRIQILYTTHSPLLFDFPDFSKLRMIRREPGGGTPAVTVGRSSLKAVSRRLAQANGLHEKLAFSESALLARLHVFGSEVAEGFFGRCVVLIEGPSDRAIIEAYYGSLGRDPLDEGIVFASLEGKTKLDRPAVVFSELGIPCFMVFDSDKKHADNVEASRAKIRLNRQLQKICGVEEASIVDWPVGVSPNFCSWETTIEEYLKAQVGEEMFGRAIEKAKSNFAVDRDDCLKTPAVASSCLVLWRESGAEFPELAALVSAVDRLLDAS
ncbi:MAG: ATP-dependent endonuclease [Hyphomonadaceae bacterium]|nr:ATP-dependent endonuclease [Hyphomonadaceae bacterium]